MVPVFCAGYVTVGVFDSKYSRFDEITTGIVRRGQLDNTLPGENYGLKYGTIIGVLASCCLLLAINLIFECHLCCNVTFVRGLRIQENNRDVFKFFLFLVLASCVYLPTACILYYRFHGLHNYKAPQNIIASYLDDNWESLQMWDKMQIWFQCCGVYNYTFWYKKLHDTHVLPDSCCKSYQISCGDFKRIEEINEAGCLPNVTAHVTDQVRYHTDMEQNVFVHMTFCY